MKNAKWKMNVAVLAATLSYMGHAHAAACVKLDAEKDGLDPSDQKAATALLEQALIAQDVNVASANCSSEYKILHIKLGESLSVILTGPEGTRRGNAARVEELGALYDQMVRSLISGESMEATNDTVTRNNVTEAQSKPKRVKADGVKYVRLGYGAIVGPAFGGGPAFGFGYRYELDNIAIDASLNFIVDGGGGDESGGVSGSWPRLAALYFFDSQANGSLYAGGGVSWGGTAIGDADGAYTGSGIQGEASVGYEFLRASTIRMFAEADVTLPFYNVNRFTLLGAEEESGYAPTVSLSFGIGWGSGRD